MRYFHLNTTVSFALKVVCFSTKHVLAKQLSQRCTFWKSERLEPVRYIAAKSAEFICLHSARITFFCAGIELPVT